MNSFFGTKKGILILNAIKYAMFFALFYLFNLGGIRGEIFPFAFSFFIALCWCNQNVFLTSGIYVASSLINNFSLENFICLACTAVVIVCCYFVHKKIKCRIPMALLPVYSLLSQTAYMVFHLGNINQIVPTLVYLVIGVLFMFACIKIFKVFLVKGVGLKLTIDESLCVCTFLVALGSGLAGTSLWGFSLINLIAVFLILLCTYIYNSSSFALVVAGSLGLGFALQTGSLGMFACLLVLAFGSVAFKSTNKYFSVMSVLICDVVLGLYFNAYGTYTYKIMVSTILGEILFLCISNKSIELLKIILGERNSTLALRNMVNRSRDNLCKRMYSLSEVFSEMDRSFKQTIRGVLPAEEAKQMLKDELFQKICYDCPEKHRCHRVLANETNEIFGNIISAGLDRGKVTILDVPPFLSTRCNRTNTIMNALNQLLASYKQYSLCTTSVDTSKALIAEEFNGVSKLLLSLADETKDLVTFNEDLEKKIMEELNYINVLSTEVYVYQKNDKMVWCTITLRTSDLDNPKLLDVLTKNFGTKMCQKICEPSNVPGLSVATFAPAPKYDCIFGTSGTQKSGNEVSGDSYSFIRLNNNKILLSVCDGMGSGEDAQKISDTTISLIENFYRADFDDETILSSVNKLLAMQMTENYSALDICVIDLQNALGDFVKVGAPESLIKHTDGTDVVEGTGALPIGILEDIKPSIVKKTLCANDIVILASDGILDAFGGAEVLQNYVNNLKINNPQELCNMILEKATALSNGDPKDDMTVLCARIFVNV